ncbi:uncharacterized protein FIBRA_05601 [Fibroporia radiculosa]|uniref:Phosphoglycerate mutase-like protein n=1 Tax=Fibroporia radiculosa TaxID=599839 RepID=J4G9S8_9APHY|nr:uncharacterized protein FIBRA_05601 [Fibroporia radiculosa]CCM03468.1 predicted protein [Fibroporia radiculosa]
MLTRFLLLCSLSFPLIVAIPAGLVPDQLGFTGHGVFQIPDPTASFGRHDSYFPGPSEVGFPGPTATGSEAAAIATAPAAALNLDTYPIIAPSVRYSGSNPEFNPMRYWGSLTPWFSVGDAFGLPNTSPQVPDGCELDQVHLLHRHGARYRTPMPGANDSDSGLPSVIGRPHFKASGPLQFLNTWKDLLGEEILTPFGRDEPFNLGVGFRVKYGELLNRFKRHLPVFRTCSQERMVQTSLNFAAGFWGIPEYLTSYHQLYIIEAPGFNNTLAPYMNCPNAFGKHFLTGIYAAGNWSELYLAETVPRLQEYIKGYTLTVKDVSWMQETCAYETVALGYSKFCELFTEDEWRGYEYASDLSFWYGFAFGNPVAAAQGIGWVQELVARLTKERPTVFDTSMNRTLNSNKITFPLDQPMYVDATHDAVIANVITALNFTTLAANGPLPSDHIPIDQESCLRFTTPSHAHVSYVQTFRVRDITPFSANLVAQVVSCATSGRTKKMPFIRFLLNDGVVPLTGLAHCEKHNRDGLCLLEDFIKGAKERISEVDFTQDCFGRD